MFPSMQARSSFLENCQTVLTNASQFLLKAVAFLLAISTVSVIFTLLLRNYVIPRGELINKQVFFDYDEARPIARINLLSKHDQWESWKTRHYESDTRAHKQMFMKSGMIYNIDAVFQLSKSEKNYKTGKFMTTFSVVDAAGDLIARSKRPIVMPYQSSLSLIMENIVKIVSWSSKRETTAVSISLMDNFYERGSGPAVETLEFELSTNEFDVEEMWVSVVPSVKGLGYYFYYYPIITTCVVVLAFFSTQLLLGLLLLIVRLMYQSISALVLDDTEDDTEDEIEDSNNNNNNSSNSTNNNHNQNNDEHNSYEYFNLPRPRLWTPPTASNEDNTTEGHVEVINIDQEISNSSRNGSGSGSERGSERGRGTEQEVHQIDDDDNDPSESEPSNIDINPDEDWLASTPDTSDTGQHLRRRR